MRWNTQKEERESTGCFKHRFTKWTCSNSFSFHNLVKMTSKDACTSSKTAYLLITIDTSASASTSFSQVGGLVERRRYHGHLVPPILIRYTFSCGILSKVECTCHTTCKRRINPNSNYRRSWRSDARDATSRVGRSWIQVGRLPHHKWRSYRTITVRGKTWCVRLPAYISK
jgi:hypothetical protein